jgi:hypothetical protein
MSNESSPLRNVPGIYRLVNKTLLKIACSLPAFKTFRTTFLSEKAEEVGLYSYVWIHLYCILPNDANRIFELIFPTTSSRIPISSY